LFLHLLSEEEKTTFWRTVLHLAEVDGNLHDHEIELKEQLAGELQLDSQPEAGSLEDLRAALRSVRRPVEANALLLELAGLAMADHELHPSEESLLEEIRRELEIPEERLELFYDLAEDSHRLTERARMAINDDSGDPV
jgi:uncharacterized tellurite resistance protein B-like protein